MFMMQLIKLLTIVLIFSYHVTTYAQNATPYYIGLKNGKVIYGDIRYKVPTFGKSYLLVNDSAKYAIKEVNYFNVQGGFYKQFIPPGQTTETLYRRVISGNRIEVYSKTVTNTSWNNDAITGMTTPMTNTRHFDYYIKDDGIPKRLKFSNLKADLSDKPESVAILRKVKGLRMLTGTLYLAGAGMFVAGIASIGNKSSSSPGEPNESGGIPPLIIAGAITMVIPNLLHFAKRDHMLDAVKAYNK